MKFEGDTDIVCPHCATEFVDHTNYIDKGDGTSTKVKCHSCGKNYTIQSSIVFNTSSAPIEDSEIDVDLGKVVQEDMYIWELATS